MFVPDPAIYTVESVTPGHPDKICDQISDAILDECLRQDPTSRVAVETAGGHGKLFIVGEITSKAAVNCAEIARVIYRDIGYRDMLDITVNVVQQSPDIAQGVDPGGAGDQGIMYGYATDETPEYLPKGVVLARALTAGLVILRKNNGNTYIPWLRPDGKSQVTIHNGMVKSVLVSTQHLNGVMREVIYSALLSRLIVPSIGDKSYDVFVNPTGSFVCGGFDADTGLTGRKIMVDTYGGLIPHGGGAFSGKDPTKVDRSAAYMARFAAKNMVANGYAKKCLVTVAYAIGLANPLMLEAVNEKGESISEPMKKRFDFRPRAIIERLALCQPRYQDAAAHGHFGRMGFPWEEIVKI